MLEEYFAKYRKNILGEGKTFEGPLGEKKIIYSDWTASGRIYGPIEDKLRKQFFPMVGNTHTETNVTGSSMTIAYHKAMNIVKKHVNATPEDIMISSNSGMTGVANKFQRILGFRVHEKYREQINLPEAESILASDTRILKDPEPFIAVGELADSSVNFTVRVWVDGADYWGVHFDTIEKVKKAFDKEGISIPFPQADVHLFNEK